MRGILKFLLLIGLLAVPPVLPAHAEDAPKAPHVRQTWQAHFAQANVAHDGHLTLAEAKDGYSSVAKHFSEIDVDGKGYVTENDIRAWHALRKNAHPSRHAPEDPLRPRNAMQHGPANPKPLAQQTSSRTP